MKKSSVGSRFDAATAVISIIIIASTLLGVRGTALYGFANSFTQKTASSGTFAAFINSVDEGTSEINRSTYTVNPLDALTATPADIQQLIELAQEKSKAEEEDGKISERKYTSADANAKAGNISIRNNTETQKTIDFNKYLTAKPEISVPDKTKPAVLIFHTHTTESYEMLDRGWYAQGYITRSKSSSRNMVRVGTEIKQQLEKAGYTVIHDTEIHDFKYTGAYDHSRKSVEKYLKQYPSIQIVLDIHRDAIEQENGVRIKPTANILGKKAAQMMIITGCEEGKVKSFPDWRDNLVFALELQNVCETMYPGLMRPVYFSQRKYNMDCSHNNLLVEVGSSTNTLDEAAFSGRLLGTALVRILDNSAKE